MKSGPAPTKALSTHIACNLTHLHPSTSVMQSQSSQRRRRNYWPQILPMASLALILSLIGKNINLHHCDALSISGSGKSSTLHYRHVPNQIYTHKEERRPSSTELSLFQRCYRHSTRSNKEVDVLEQKKSARNRLQIEQIMKKYCRKFSFRTRVVSDDALKFGSFVYSSASSTAAHSYSPTATIITRPQKFSNSQLQFSVSTSTAITALRRQRERGSLQLSSSSTRLQVLSTPDTIIEQASTQKLLDTLLDESVRTQSRQPVMLQFSPKRGWIWRQWRGTVFSETWKSGLTNMALATLVVFLYRLYPSLKDLLQGFSILWGQLLSVTTFTLTFFLNQSYGLWRKCYDYSRRLQGRLNDLGMTLAAHATRTKPSSPDIPSTYTPQSRQALELVSRYVRVFNLLTYASFTRSHRPILTPRGMRRMVERGILTPKEREILTDAEVPATQRHNAVLVWLIRLFLEGRQAGVFEGGTGFGTFHVYIDPPSL